MGWPSILLLSGLLAVIVQSGDAKRGFMLTAPRTLRGGTTEHLDLRVFEVGAKGSAKIFLVKNNENEILAETEVDVLGDGNTNVSLRIPTTDVYSARLNITGSFETDDNYKIEGSAEVSLQNRKPRIIFVQTDKPIYRPGQTVKFRILPVDQELKPLGKDTVGQVRIEDPSGVRVAQWKDVTFPNGMVQLENPLSEEPPLGQWVIIVKVNDTEHRQYFTVEEYVLPKFEVTITPPSVILLTDPIITYEVCGKYTYGKLVEGKVNITASYERYAWSDEKLPTLEVISPIEGCYSYPVNVSQLAGSSGYYTYRTIVITAEITETGTGIKQNKTFKTTTREGTPFKFTFEENANNDYYKAGLPYYGKLKVTTPDNKPASGRLVELCFSPSWERVLTTPSHLDTQWWATRKSSTCKNFTSGDDGIINFTIPPQNIYSVGIVITAKSMDYKEMSKDDSSGNTLYQPQTTRSLRPWYSPSRSFIQLQPINEDLKCGQSNTIRMLYTSNEGASYKLYYQLKSRGSTVGEGIHEYSFDASNDISGQSDDTYINGDEIVEVPPIVQDKPDTSNAEEKPEARYIGETSFELSTTPSMSPMVRLLVFYIKDDGEVISDSINVRIAKCLQNEVSMEFGQERQQPGTTTSIKVTADPLSVCGVGVVDKSVHLLRSDNQLTKEKVFNIIAGLDVGSYRSNVCPNSVHGGPIPFGRSRFIPYPWNSYSPYEDAITSFQVAGYAVISDLTLITRPCRINTPSYTAFSGGAGYATFAAETEMPVYHTTTVENDLSTSLDSGATTKSVVEIRTYFPETWLWESYSIGEDGEVIVKQTLPHTITEWVGSAVCLNSESGLGLSDTASITAYQDFFVSFSLPYSIIRGETVPLVVSVFNYISECLPIKLSLDVTEDFELVRGSPSIKICVCGGKSVTHRFVIRPVVLGQVNFTVQGQSVQDDAEICGDRETSSVVARDGATRSLLVEAEGFPKEDTVSTFFCPKDSEGETFKTEIDLILPENVVEDSGRAFFSVSGDLMGPAIQGLDNLVRQPTGCGEQNMVLFVPIIFVLDYLKSSDQLTAELEKKALEHMRTGYQRELKYRHNDGSYSAFGPRDREGSIWLSAFVLKAFSQANRFITVDENDLTRTLNWIISKQELDGCFPEVGKVLHSAMKGGLDSSKGSQGPLTAYILISLLESSYSNSTVIQGALSCMRGEKSPSPYTLSLFAYASALNDPSSASVYVDDLMKQATQKGDVMYWENEDSASSRSTNIETAAYVVLTLMQLGGRDNVAQALPIVRWIAQQRNSRGGFVSTQDTVVALQALAKYASYIGKEAPDITVKGQSNDWEQVFTINNDNKLLVQRVKVPSVPTGLDIEATGSGCAVLQTNLRYNVKSVEVSKAFELTVTSKRGVFGDCRKSVIASCFRYIPEGQKSNMAVLEVKMVSGYVPDRDTLESLVVGVDSLVKRYEVENNVVNLYFDEITNEKKCVKFAVEQDAEVEDLKPAVARIYDYYAEEKTESVDYTISNECGDEATPSSTE